MAEANLTFTADGETYTIQPTPSDLSVWGMATGDTGKVDSAAGSTTDGHLNGLWSLPHMIGEVADNILLGGGIAPERVKYGARPVDYRVYITGGNRSEVVKETSKLTNLLARGNVESNNHGYGYTRLGYLAAPPTVEWVGYSSNMVQVDFTLSFLDPLVMAGNYTSQQLLDMFTGTMTNTDTDALTVVKWSPWSRKESEYYTWWGCDITITNRGEAAVTPLLGVELGTATGSANYNGFEVWIQNRGGGTWIADKYRRGKYIIDPSTGLIYDVDSVDIGDLRPVSGESFTMSGDLSIGGGETLTYRFEQYLNPDTAPPIVTPQPTGAAIVATWGRY